MAFSLSGPPASRHTLCRTVEARHRETRDQTAKAHLAEQNPEDSTDQLRNGSVSMNAQSQGDDRSLSDDESTLVELERDETIIETEEQRGFGDAARMNQVKSEIEELETDNFHERVQSKDESR